MGSEFFHAGRQIEKETDMMKLTAAFGNFANAPKNQVTTFTPSPLGKA